MSSEAPPHVERIPLAAGAVPFQPSLRPARPSSRERPPLLPLHVVCQRTRSTGCGPLDELKILKHTASVRSQVDAVRRDTRLALPAFRDALHRELLAVLRQRIEGPRPACGKSIDGGLFRKSLIFRALERRSDCVGGSLFLRLVAQFLPLDKTVRWLPEARARPRPRRPRLRAPSPSPTIWRETPVTPRARRLGRRANVRSRCLSWIARTRENAHIPAPKRLIVPDGPLIRSSPFIGRSPAAARSGSRAPQACRLGATPQAAIATVRQPTPQSTAV